ncbi:transmembrane protein 154 isoform X1 [Xyrichtys novacula]|uniref:Transmembrane protein 154 isoform X1 n=1 Tax=Xyrichtys novacula TaxID=13765 RepID=A0AAV1EV07_XYRNO|nr:transmembrane protein 154 isoform X1 [Xyrichtys novacula]
MFAPRPCNMRGPQLKTLLFLLFLLLTALTQTALCQEEDGVEPDVTETEEETTDLEAAVEDEIVTPEPEVTDPDATSAPTQQVPEDTEDSSSGDSAILPDNGESTPDPGIIYSTSSPDVDEGLGPIIILIPVVLVVVIIGMIVCGILINRRWNNKARDQELRKEDPYLDGSSTEKVPMPMFEEDVPSVLELEMEELDQWMKKDGANAEESKLA